MEKLNLNIPGSSVTSYNGNLHAKMRADSLNQMPGDLTGYECKKCRNRGYIAFPREDGTIFTRQCNCMNFRKCVWEMERSGLKNAIQELTFDRFQATQPWQQRMKEGATAYALSPAGWFMIGGQSGCGKTHLCTAICRERLLKGDQVLYMPWREKIAQLKAMSLDSDQRGKLMDSFKNAQVLYIDDLFKTGRGTDGTDNPTASDISLAFEILNHRYVNRMHTVISSEKSPMDLVAIDEAIGSRIIEAAGSHVYNIKKEKRKNYRLRNVIDL